MIDVEYLTDELCLLPGGIADDRLASLPTLRRLAGVPDGTLMIQAASLIRAWLKRGILAIEEPVVFQGITLSRDVQIRAFNTEFEFEMSRTKAPERRHNVIQFVNARCSTQMWRRRYERKFLYILAEHLYQITESQPLEAIR